MDKIKRIPTKIIIHEYLITFEYETWKGQERKIDKRILKIPNCEDPKKVFKEWVKSIRTIAKAEILVIVEIKENKQEIVL